MLSRPAQNKKEDRHPSSAYWHCVDRMTDVLWVRSSLQYPHVVSHSSSTSQHPCLLELLSGVFLSSGSREFSIRYNLSFAVSQEVFLPTFPLSAVYSVILFLPFFLRDWFHTLLQIATQTKHWESILPLSLSMWLWTSKHSYVANCSLLVQQRMAELLAHTFWCNTIFFNDLECTLKNLHSPTQN